MNILSKNKYINERFLKCFCCTTYISQSPWGQICSLASGNPLPPLFSSSKQGAFSEWLPFLQIMKLHSVCSLKCSLSIIKQDRTPKPPGNLISPGFWYLWIQPNLSILRSYRVLVPLLDWGRNEVQAEALQALICFFCRLLQKGFMAKCHFCLKVPRG